MEIRQLEYFLMVSRTASFTRAAERLFVSQPAVTNAVKSLEDELGIQLFSRNQKQALLTSEGKIFCAHVEKLMHGITNTLEEIHAIKNLSGGVLHIGLTALGGLRPGAVLMKNFLASYPSIRLLLEESDTDTLHDLLMEDKLDLAVLWEEKSPTVFTYQKLAQQELVICCGRKHRFRRKNILRREDLAGEQILLLRDRAFRDLITASLLLDEAVFITEVSHVQTIKSLVAIDCGIAVLPECLVETDNDIALVPLEPQVNLSPVIACRKSRHLSHAANAFKELAKKEV